MTSPSNRRVGAEHHDLHHLMFIVTVVDGDASVDRLVAAMRDLARVAPELGGRKLPCCLPSRNSSATARARTAGA